MDVDGADNHHFLCNMKSLTEQYGLPPFPGFGQAAGAITWENPDGLTLTSHIVDYYANHRLSKSWSKVERWRECMGINVVVHYVGGAGDKRPQVSSSCGVVAARVLTWARQDFGRHRGTFNLATSREVLKAANNELVAVDRVPSGFANTRKTQFLSASAVNFLGQRFMEQEAGIDVDAIDDPLQQWPFECVTVDQLLVRIALRITEAAQDPTSGQYYFCANSEATGSGGFHWVSCILDIHASTEQPAHISRLDFSDD